MRRGRRRRKERKKKEKEKVRAEEKRLRERGLEFGGVKKEFLCVEKCARKCIYTYILDDLPCVEMEKNDVLFF